REAQACRQQGGGQQDLDQGKAARALGGDALHCSTATGSGRTSRSESSCRRLAGSPSSPQRTSSDSCSRRGAAGSMKASGGSSGSTYGSTSSDHRYRPCSNTPLRWPSCSTVPTPTSSSSDCACSAARPASSAQRTWRDAPDNPPSSSVSASARIANATSTSIKV